MATAPTDLSYGFVAGRYLLAYGDRAFDADSLPDVVPAVGTVRFRWLGNAVAALKPVPAAVVPQTVDAKIAEADDAGAPGDLLDNAGRPGVWLVSGVYEVSFRFVGVTVPSFRVTVGPEHTESSPLYLPLAAPLIPTPGIRFVINEQIYTDTLAARDAALAAVADVPLRVAAELDATLPRVADEAVDNAIADRELVEGRETDADSFTVGYDDSSAPFFVATEADGVVSKITHLPESVPTEALVDFRELPAESTFAFVLESSIDGRAVWGVRNDGTITGMEAYALRDTAPVIYDAVGDSTTFGAGATDDDALLPSDTWTAKLSARLGVPVNNWGASGARAEELAARVGGIAPLATVTGGSIPASGSVALEAMSVLPMRAGAVTSYAAELVLASGVRVKGTLRRASATSHTFTRSDSGAVIPAPGRVEVVSLFGADVRARRLILGMGVNNEAAIVAGTQTVADVKRWYAAATTGLSHRPLVWGVLDRGPTEAAGTAIGDYIRALEQWLAEKYGADYVSVRQYLASERALTDALLYAPGFVPTDADRAAIAVGTVPPSFRVAATSVHLNALGHSLQAGVFYNHLTTKGAA